MSKHLQAGPGRLNRRCPLCRKLRKHHEPDGNHGGEVHRLRRPGADFWLVTPFGACCGFCVVRHITPEVLRHDPQAQGLVRRYVASFAALRPGRQYTLVRLAQAKLQALDALLANSANGVDAGPIRDQV